MLLLLKALLNKLDEVSVNVRSPTGLKLRLRDLKVHNLLVFLRCVLVDPLSSKGFHCESPFLRGSTLLGSSLFQRDS